MIRLKSILIMILITGAFIFASCNSSEVKVNCGISDSTQAGIDHLKKLTDAMEKYKKVTGRYPENVTDLIPEYAEKIAVVNFSLEGFDKTKYDVLQSDRLQASGPFINDDGSYFSIKLLPKDDRICLTGKNNICEYTSQTKQWNCYIH